ncbi:HIT family protein [Corynebacterium choanae]|uniref:AP-4-A phosphorylase n=1 Tax=Corynebacterium choanae TaxID=1862358 RepID=A0A3G6J7G6_9CORY|nr:HIT domain-containing protein [Corynebacterium choanae]AZA13713.1 AP-4-A phosphorylase [Corynebacterium choanae]
MQDDSTIVDQGLGTPDRLLRLWAPYRMHYIAQSPATADASNSQAAATSAEQHAAPEKDTDTAAARATRKDPFLVVPTLSDEDGLIVARGTHVFCVLNLYPYNPGHMMVIPYRKVANLEDLTQAESRELMAFAQHAIRCVKQVSHPDAVNAGFNLGKASGGSVGDHLHMHIVPRWSGDANFMTVIDGVKVLPQTLQDTRTLLAQAWQSLPHPDLAG